MDLSNFGEVVKVPYVKNLIYEEIKQVLQINEVNNFIGNHPIGLTRQRISFLLNNDYLVCEKSDGIRVMLLFYKKTLFLYDRTCNFYKTDYILTSDKTFLIDGELYDENESFIFAIFDLLIYESNSVLSSDLLHRLGKAKQFCNKIIPRSLLKKNGSKLESMKIKCKDMLKSYGMKSILDFIPQLKHKNDGLIFTPVNDPYFLFQRSKILKWKPPSLNTADLYIKKTRTPHVYELACDIEDFQVKLYGRRTTNREKFHIGFFYAPDEINYSDKIGEFGWDEDLEVFDLVDGTFSRGGWLFHRFRHDKTLSNNIKIVLDLFDSNKDVITSEILTEMSDQIRKNYKERECNKEAKKLKK
ncbi:hypothetical protein NUSPORA_00335 [Nucleospora cyclopteri]